MSVMNDQAPNPYESPQIYTPKPKSYEDELRTTPCPRCDSTDVFATPYSEWHGRRGPKAVEDMTCRNCQCNFNGETGVEYPPRRSPILWFLLSVVLVILYFAVLVFFG